jgi:glutathione S-transferase
MNLTLHFHPLASFCWKVLVALYENDTPFEPHLVDLGDANARAEFASLWPLAKFPVLVDSARGRTIPESTIIIEYLAQHYPGRTPLVPRDLDAAREVRLRDRFYDLYVHAPMQKIVGDRLRAPAQRDPRGVEEARATLATAYAMVEAGAAGAAAATGAPGATGALGDTFTMADCAASPALYYANRVHPFGPEHPNVAAYLGRLVARPSFARVLDEAQPYFKHFPE